MSSLTLQATQSFRNTLLAKNLPPYNIQGQYTPNTSSYKTPISLSNFSVIDSPNEYVRVPPFREALYPLNIYGPEGGFNPNIRLNYPISGEYLKPNKGEYNPNETNMDLLYESRIDISYNENRYGPSDGFNLMYFISDTGVADKLHTPYWNPPSFVLSTYNAYNILISNNPVGTSGLLSEDSSLAMIGGMRLKILLQDRLNTETLDILNNRGENNFSITTPSDTTTTTSSDLISRLNGSYSPTSPIPGSYFTTDERRGPITQQTSRALSAGNLIGSLLGPIITTELNPSLLFLSNTGLGQKSKLFSSIDFNVYQPDYNKFRPENNNQSNSENVQGDNNLRNQYYVGSSKIEPKNITSPKNQVPVDEFGRQTLTPVYGPTDLSLLYEGNETKLNFGLQGKPLVNGGGINGQFTWVSPKYKNSAGFKATVGGGKGRVDGDYYQINSQFQRSESTNVEFKKGSILDDTQRLVESADKITGISKLKHVGNAINQVSKVFNDGYKEITKGSKVLSYVNNATGFENGIEYARVFTKDTPYYTYNDLQKKDGITTSGRRFNNSILDNTFNLNIAPYRGNNSTNIKNQNGQKSVKKYMFSIENLAWRTSSRPGFTVEDLPDCEKGPNGGRIMWFPPYDLKFSDSSTPSFQGTSFLGRPEPMYTYKETSRSGTLSWKIIVDHPSILNVIIRKQLKGIRQERIDSILNSFFAGAMKYDIYELAKRFGTIPPSTIRAIQRALNETNNPDDVEKLVNEISSSNDGNQNIKSNTTSIDDLKNQLTSSAFYFPRVFSENSTYEQITSSYTKKDNDFFTTIIQPNNNSLNDLKTSINNFLTNNDGVLTFELLGSIQNYGSSFPFSESKKQLNVVENFFNNDSNIKKLIDTKKIVIKTLANNYESTTPKNGGGSSGESFDCSKKDTDEASKSSTACRRVNIKNVSFIPNPNKEPNSNENISGNKKLNRKDIFESLKEGLSKKILRNLLTECDYFDMLKENSPMVFDSIQERFKYFNPAFHSMTPEGLNSRLTFLNQCVRPGETIPVIGLNNQTIQNNALNTSFGAPPILVLRIGDFFHTKIVPTSLSLGYDPLELDLNPEGIGVQPMIASISMNFNIIGGMGIARPVEELQNALSFNFYANTEIYDERATPTEDTSKIDKEFYRLLKDKINDIANEDSQTNGNGNTIGQILTTVNVTGGEIGEIDYSKIMDTLLDSTRTYFESTLNSLDSIQEQYNFGIVQILNKERKYTKGTIKQKNSTLEIEIFGKPENIEETTNEIFESVKESIEDNTNPIIEYLNRFFSSDIDSFPMRVVKNNMIEYVDSLSSDFLLPLSEKIQQLSEQQQTYIQNIRKLNIVAFETDGKQSLNGTPKVYNISGEPLNQIVTDYSKLKDAIDRYNTLLSSGDDPIAFYEFEGITLVKENKFETDAERAFFIIMSRILTDKDKKQDFIDSVIKDNLTSVNEPVKLINKFENIVSDLESKYKNELKAENRLFNRIKRAERSGPAFSSEYRKLTKGIEKIMYKKNIDRKCKYTTIRDEVKYPTQEAELNKLFASVNSDADTETFTNKITFQ